VVILFAALPTASSAYVLAARMGGKAAPVAVIVTLQTCVSIVTLPVWVAMVFFSGIGKDLLLLPPP